MMNGGGGRGGGEGGCLLPMSTGVTGRLLADEAGDFDVCVQVAILGADEAGD